MAWLIISIPLMVLAICIAVVPVTWQSLRFNRREHGSLPAVPVTTPTRAAAGSATRATVGVACPLCTAQIRGATTEVLVDAVGRHAWRFHGIPSASHITEAARAA